VLVAESGSGFVVVAVLVAESGSGFVVVEIKIVFCYLIEINNILVS
jgi:hypothetical protein